MWILIIVISTSIASGYAKGITMEHIEFFDEPSCREAGKIFIAEIGRSQSLYNVDIVCVDRGDLPAGTYRLKEIKVPTKESKP